MTETQKSNTRQSIMPLIAAGITIICTVVGTTWKVTNEIVKPMALVEGKMELIVKKLEDNEKHINLAQERFRLYDEWSKQYQKDVVDMRTRVAELHTFILQHMDNEAKKPKELHGIR